MVQANGPMGQESRRTAGPGRGQARTGGYGVGRGERRKSDEV